MDLIIEVMHSAPVDQWAVTDFFGTTGRSAPADAAGHPLQPLHTPPILFYEGLGYHSLGRYEEAMAAFDQTRATFAKGGFPLALLAMTSADMGRMEEARAAAQVFNLTRSYQIFSAKGFVNALDYRDRAKSDRALATLLQLGLPE